MRAVALACCVAFALVAAGCDDEKQAVPVPQPTTTPASDGEVIAWPESCGDVQTADNGADVIVQSDLPLQGPARMWSVQSNKAMVQVLEDHEWRAGKINIAFQECDDATAAAGGTDTRKCSVSAEIAAANLDAVAVIGPRETFCAEAQLRAYNKAGLPSVGLATGACLTRDIDCDASESQRSVEPTFVRVVPSTLVQAAALAQYAEREGNERLYLLDDGGSEGREFAEAFANAAEELGLTVVGSSAWGSDPAPAMRKAAAARPDAVVLAGDYAATAIREKVRRLGPNSGEVALLASEGYRRPAVGAWPQAEGMVVASPFVPTQLLPEPGKEFVRELYGATREPIQPESAYAAQAAELVLRAMEESDGTRAGIRDALFGMKIEDGLLGDFEIDENGDAVGLPVALYRVQSGANAYLRITPPAELVDAAAG